MTIKKPFKKLLIVGLFLLSLSAFGFLVFVVFLGTAWNDKDNTFEDDCLEATTVLNPLVEALHTYKLDNGNYPLSLDSLVTKYIYDIPTLPESFYKFVGKKGIQYKVLNSDDTQPFELKIERPGGMASDITLYYFSNPNLDKCRPESSTWFWKNYKHKVVVCDNWVYCY